MTLNTDFYEGTKLRDWWPKVKENFELIENAANELEARVNNAMTKRDVNSYFNSVLNASGASINAIEELAAALAEADEDVAEAIQNLSGGRLKAVTLTTQASIATKIAELDGVDNAILIFKAGATDSPVTPKSTGITVLHTQEADYLFSPGAIYSKTGAGAWTDIYAGVKADVENCKSTLLKQTDVLFGKYTGNGISSRNISLSGHIPADYRIVAVEIYQNNGMQFDDGGDESNFRGGMAMIGNVLRGYSNTAAEIITDTGFRLAPQGQTTNSGGANILNEVYYFAAYIRKKTSSNNTSDYIIEIS